MKKFLLPLTLWMLLFTILHAQEFVYVTDSLQLRVYSQPNDASEILTTIESGDSVEILERRSAFSRVKTYDDAEGWVKSAFLVDEPPAKLLYYSVSEENKELKARVETLQSADHKITLLQNDAADKKKIEELQTALTNKQKEIQLLEQQLVQVKSENHNGRLNKTTSTKIKTLFPMQTDNSWLFPGLAAVLLLMGFLLGAKLSSWRMQKRLHGFRLK